MMRRAMAMKVVSNSCYPLGHLWVGVWDEPDIGLRWPHRKSSSTASGVSGSVTGTASESGARRERAGCDEL